MAAGVAPIRARKARYFRDRRLMARVLPPPAVGGTPKPRTDDWSLLPEPQRPAPKEAKADEEESEASDTENAGIRQEPDRKSTRLNSSHSCASRMPSSA